MSEKRSQTERFDTFLANANIKLPERSFAAFVKNCQKQARRPKEVKDYLSRLEEDGYRELYERLFAPEVEMAQNFSHRSLINVETFDRSADDIASLEARGWTLDEMKAGHDKTVSDRFAGLLSAEVVSKTNVKAICEIGPAWGPAVAYLQERFQPTTYHAYEIDGGWCRRLREKFGVDAKTVDGETLSETADRSMDLVIASSCLYFMPELKQWSYLRDMARVLAPNGLVMFNALVVERVDERYLQSLLDNYFPKRIFGLIPHRFIDMNFPGDRFELLLPPTPETFGYEIHRKRA
jgi:phospholipid N-methyltransferase